MKQTDEELILLCSEGGDDAFNELYNRYKDKIFSFILQYVRNQRTAEDIFQETFFRVVKNSGRFIQGKKFSSWMYTIAANLCRDELKRRKRRRGQVSLEREIRYDRNEQSGIELKDTIKSRESSPLENAETSEMSHKLGQAMQRLPEKYRMALELNVRHELKYREVARILKCPLGTVKSRIHKAIIMLRDDLSKRGFLENN